MILCSKLPLETYFTLEHLSKWFQMDRWIDQYSKVPRTKEFVYLVRSWKNLRKNLGKNLGKTSWQDVLVRILARRRGKNLGKTSL